MNEHYTGVQRYVSMSVHGSPAMDIILAFAISWIGILVVAGGPGNVPGSSAQVEQLFLPAILAWLAGPSIASIVLTGLVDGRAGYRTLVARLLTWRMSWRWYAVALLGAPLMYVAVAFTLSLTSAEFLPGILITGDRSALLVMGLGYGLLGGGFLEELGWTGWAAYFCAARPAAAQLHPG
jgi:uncharacterized protein